MAKRCKSWAMLISSAALSSVCAMAVSASDSLYKLLDDQAKRIAPQVINWRRDIHAHPELGNREFRTSSLVAEHLKSLGFDRVMTEVAHTGVVGILKGGKPGPTVALRADMDALPVTEQLDLPFASRVRTSYNGEEVGVMHACGHDAHTAMLMGVAEVLSSVRDQIPGTVKFIFQPSEEGAPAGEEGGAALMVKQGVLQKPKPDAVFGLHVMPADAGQIGYMSGGALAGSTSLQITVKGEQTHGAAPWFGRDPITVAGQIVTALQTIPSRQLDITRAPAVVTIGSIHGGVRGNIIPDSVTMDGTIRVLDPAMQEDFYSRIRRTATKIAESAGLEAEVTIPKGYPVTYNDPDLVARLLPTLKRPGLASGIKKLRPMTGSEDFAFFHQDIPGFYFFLGVNKERVDQQDAAPNHSPYFYVNEDALITGVRAMASLALDYLRQPDS